MKRKLTKPILLLIVLFTLVFSTGVITQVNQVSALSYQSMALTNATVTVNGLNVRQGPGVAYASIAKVNSGDTLKVFGLYGSWYFIVEPRSGRVGAVSSLYIKLVTTTTTPKTTPKVTAKPNPTANPNVAISADEQKLLNLINAERSKAGVSPLSFDMTLLKISRLKAKDLVDNNYFAHQSPTYGSPFDMMKQFGVSFKSAGENIAGNSSIENAVQAWMNSEGHRKNILNPSFNFTGVGIVNSPKYGYVFVQQFIGR